MSLPQDHNNLFRHSDISDQLSLMQSLLDSKDLTPAEAIALLHIIRVELESPQLRRSSIYRRYTQLMQSLRREMPEVHEQVVQAWEAKKANLPTNKKTNENVMASYPSGHTELAVNPPADSSRSFDVGEHEEQEEKDEEVEVPSEEQPPIEAEE